jgi:glycosyltransferase involved in cell wall biosynthesis
MSDRMTAAKRPRVALLTIHPAPYRDPALTLVHQRRRVDLKVYLLSMATSRHPYWQPGQIVYPHEVLRPELHTSGAFHLDPSIWRKLKGYDVVCITGHQYHTLKIALLRCLMSRIPYVWIADSVLQASPVPWRKKLQRWVYQAIMQFIVGYMGSAWVPGQATRDYLVHHGGAPNRIFAGSYCLDVDTLIRQSQSLESRRRVIRRELNLADEQVVFLFVGRLVSQRGIPILLEAWRRLAVAHPEVTLLIVGQGPERSRAEQFVRKHRLTQVRFFDPVAFEVLPEYYVACDAYVQPSISEPYSLSTAQAAIFARPIVVTDRVGAGADYLVEGKTGYLAQAGDVHSLLEAVEHLIADRRRMSEMGRQAQKVAEQRTLLWAAEQFEQAVLVAHGCSVSVESHSRTRM